MIAKAGDVFCVYNSYLEKYTACQITKTNDDIKKQSAVLLTLDWFGDVPLKAKELINMKPLYIDFMFWNKSLHLSNVDAKVPSNYIFVGNTAPLTDESTNSYSVSWGNGYSAYRQLMWQQIPQERRKAFKNAINSKERVKFGDGDMAVSISRINDDIVSFEDALDLKVFPCLYCLNCKSWHKNLYEYLKSCPFLIELTIENHGQSILDFSNTHLNTLHVDMKGVKELYLNDNLEQLYFIGDVEDNCKIHAYDGGAKMLLTQSATIPKIEGLNNLGKLHCSNITNIDLSKILSAYPNLKELRLWGKPGMIENFALIKEFKNLEGFTTNEIFGFSADDIPQPESMQKLNWFWMSSLPEDSAKKAKQLYKPKEKEGLNLWIQKPRKAEWLAQNLDNPFRSWDGQENIPTSAAKKAADLYKKTRAKITSLDKLSKDEAYKAAKESVTEYTQGFNKMDKGKFFIETIEREEIYCALVEILELIPSSLSIDRDELLELFDSIRDF